MPEFIVVPQQITQITQYQGQTQLVAMGLYVTTKTWAATTAPPAAQIGYSWAIWDINAGWIADLATQEGWTPAQLQQFFNDAGTIV